MINNLTLVFFTFRVENMKINVLSSIIFILLANDSHADGQTNQNSLITTYDPEASL